MIEFKNVTKKFGSYTVLDELSLSIETGKLTFILGKSGEGKSVTMKHILGLMQPNSGVVTVAGEDISRYSKAELLLYRRNFGMLFQQAALFDSMTVLSNVLFPLQENTNLKAMERLQRAEEVLQTIGLDHLKHTYPNELSTGEKKRVGLARALAAKPKIMLYDEPTTGMDPLVCEMIDELIVEVNQREVDMTSIVVSHDLKAALATADKIIMLYKGKVALAGTAADFRNSTDPIVRQFFSGKVEGPMEFI